VLKLLTIVALLAAESPAHGLTPAEKNGDDEVSMFFYASDLDLSTLEGTRILQQRIDSAARKACGSVDYTDRAAVATIEDCLQSLKASAYENVLG
jgi:UrcA family protein